MSNGFMDPLFVLLEVYVINFKQKLKSYLVILSAAVFFTQVNIVTAASEMQKQQIKSIAIDTVWSGHRIKPYLLTRGEHQYLAYFDANRQMTVAHRKLGAPWRYYKVDSWLGWDSHNYVTLEVDSEGHIHVMGNIHADPMEYFRTSEPHQVRSLKRIEVMVDKSVEQRMTYPIFMLNKAGELLVKYRDGGSGNGNEIYNIYDTKTKTWSRLHANQFLDGQGLMSGYFEGPTLGPDGNFHLIWVWRNTPNAATNHSLSYARSPDLVSWEDSSGNPLALPLTLAKTEVVDPVKPGEGMINGNVKLGFDKHNKPMITYHKYDPNGDTQMYLARREQASWNSVQISDWKGFRWEFGGGGSLGRFPVKPYKPSVLADGNIGVLVRKNDEVMRIVVDHDSLRTTKIEPAELYPSIIQPVTKNSNSMMMKSTELPLEHSVFSGKGDLGPEGQRYYLSWYSQPGNRDRAHVVISQPSVLLLHEFSEN
ncbi:BNR repeat-containing protein [Paraglaciecola aquimarina]|uniref:BNR repeat-containing protein n=1 Tax=Paraglaciecola algarum TaxID=3050085 RepID=A0ABS9D5L1_9ALTE|nr:BNR repeat-containing protein [Paraglaciecola sp. G1-23]MCF2946961.1 BNR repeat-containing protein [Paraglaciecola sp. G1-23]